MCPAGTGTSMDVPGGSVMSSTSGSVVGRVTAPATPWVLPAITRTCTPFASANTGTPAGGTSW